MVPIGFISHDWAGASCRLACFAMICRHCGTCYAEFFPSARQENLFIGTVHAFAVMGVPERALTDNMKSVVIRRDIEGKPIWQADYAAFMACAKFKTRLCKPRHPFTKGKVERLVGFVKGNFLAGRSFVSATDLNAQALEWCVADPQGSRGRRFRTKPGENCQMDWGFVKVEDWIGGEFKIACFAMVCHHCGTCYVEFFPNARQENLFIGMIHAFMVMGVPECVLTDNMKSVTIGRDVEGRPVWQADYAAFMACVGFKTKLCKPYHPFTKGKVERLIKYVKGNFLAGRRFYNATDLNVQALEWCAKQSGRYRRAVDCVPAEEHAAKCLPAATELERTEELAMYLCPRRRISFDGFVSYEGRRFGVPYWYPGKTCRVSRDGERIHIYADDLSRELAVHPVTWSRNSPH